MLLKVESQEGPVWIQIIEKDGIYRVRSAPYTMFFPSEAQKAIRDAFAKISYNKFNKGIEEMQDALKKELGGRTFQTEVGTEMSMDEWLVNKARIQKLWFTEGFRQQVQARVNNPKAVILWQER